MKIKEEKFNHFNYFGKYPFKNKVHIKKKSIKKLHNSKYKTFKFTRFENGC